MPTVRFTVKATRRTPSAKQILDRLDQTLTGRVAQDLTAYFQDIFANWEHKPDISVSLRREEGASVLRVAPSGESATIWRWVSKGTPPHPIAARNAPRLVFPFQGAGNSYDPKTSGQGPGSIVYGGPGQRKGKLVRPMQVTHPGIEPRQFERWIVAQYQPKFASIMQAALEQALRQGR